MEQNQETEEVLKDIENLTEEREKKVSRTSILKRKSMNQSIANEANESVPDIKDTRRVSFAPSNFVKMFKDDPEKNTTIWDNTYEEVVDQTDSTKSTQSSAMEIDCSITKSSGVILTSYNILEDLEMSCNVQQQTNQILNTTAFQNADSSMQLTCDLTDPSGYKTPVDQNDVSSMQFTCVLLDPPGLKTLVQNESNLQLLTHVSPVAPEPKYPVDQKDDSSMQFTCVLQNLSGFKTVNQNDPRLQLTCVSPDPEESKNPVDRKDDSSMEFTCVLPIPSGFKIPIDPKVNSSMQFANAFKKKTITETCLDEEKENIYLPNFPEKNDIVMDMEITRSLADFYSPKNISEKQHIENKENEISYMDVIEVTKSAVEIYEDSNVETDILQKSENVKSTKDEKNSSSFENMIPVQENSVAADIKIISNSIKENYLTEHLHKEKIVIEYKEKNVSTSNETVELVIYKELEENCSVIIEDIKINKNENSPKIDSNSSKKNTYLYNETASTKKLNEQKQEGIRLSSNVKLERNYLKILKNDCFLNSDEPIDIVAQQHKNNTTAFEEKESSRKSIDFFSGSHDKIFLTNSGKQKLFNDFGKVTPGKSFALCTGYATQDKDETIKIPDIDNKPRCEEEEEEDIQPLFSQINATNLDDMSLNFVDFCTSIDENLDGILNFEQENLKDEFQIKLEEALDRIKDVDVPFTLKFPAVRPYEYLSQRIVNYRKKLKDIAQNLKFAHEKLVGVEELDKLEDEKKQSRSSISISDGEFSRGSSENRSEDFDTIEAPKSLEERVKERLKSLKYAKLVKILKDDCFCFYTYSKAVLFQSYIDANSGIVLDTEAFLHLIDNPLPTTLYECTCLTDKLQITRLHLTLGKEFDLITFVDYAYVCTEETKAFQKEIRELQTSFGESHRFRMNPDFSITIEFINAIYRIWWIITLELEIEHIGRIQYIGSKHHENHAKSPVDESEIQKMFETTSSPNLIENFIKNIDDFIKQKGPSILVKRKSYYNSMLF